MSGRLDRTVWGLFLGLSLLSGCEEFLLTEPKTEAKKTSTSGQTSPQTNTPAPLPIQTPTPPPAVPPVVAVAENLFGLDAPVGGQFKNDGMAVTLGIKFTPLQTGKVTRVRFYKSAGTQGVHEGALYTVNGALLSQTLFVNEGADGWQEAVLPAPIAVQANQIYVVAVHMADGSYTSTQNYFDNQAVNSGNLRAPLSAEVAGNGVYRYGAVMTFPDQTFQGSNYWIDLVYLKD